MQQGINILETYSNSPCSVKQHDEHTQSFFDGDPMIPGLTGVGSDVGIGNAEICLITAQFLKNSSVSVRIFEEFWLILPEATAIGVRLSHASREVQDLGILLSNTWTI